MNSTCLVGRLVRDPELKRTQSNISYVRFTLAVNRSFKDESGETQADFISCIAWRAQAENLARFMKQGSQIGLVGRIQTGSYESDKGTIYTTDVVADNIQFLESKPKQDNKDNDYYEQEAPLDDSGLPF